MRVLPDFLKQIDIEDLFVWLPTAVYEPGRQGTGYEKVPVPQNCMSNLRRRSLRAMGLSGEESHDCYVIRYTESTSIPRHVDDAMGAQHWRLNAILQAPDEGGVLAVDGITHPLFQRDAYVFRPDIEEHEVSPILKGMRLVWSVGTLV